MDFCLTERVIWLWHGQGQTARLAPVVARSPGDRGVNHLGRGLEDDATRDF